MDTELEKLVEAGKLTPRAAQKLEKLKPGTFCLHKSWGFGRVSDWNLLLNQIVIDFAGKKSHPMQAEYAAENVTPLAPEHFLARKATDLTSIKSLARENPPALEQIVKSHQQFREPEKQLQPIIATIENMTVRNQKMHPEFAFDLVIVRDDLLERLASLHSTHVGLTLSKLILDEEERLISVLQKLPAAKEKRILQALPTALGPRWTERGLDLIQASHGRMVAQIPRILSDGGQHDELRTMLERSIREHSATSEMLAWLCS